MANQEQKYSQNKEDLRMPDRPTAGAARDGERPETAGERNDPAYKAKTQKAAQAKEGAYVKNRNFKDSASHASGKEPAQSSLDELKLSKSPLNAKVERISEPQQKPFEPNLSQNKIQITQPDYKQLNFDKLKPAPGDQLKAQPVKHNIHALISDPNQFFKKTDPVKKAPEVTSPKAPPKAEEKATRWNPLKSAFTSAIEAFRKPEPARAMKAPQAQKSADQSGTTKPAETKDRKADPVDKLEARQTKPEQSRIPEKIIRKGPESPIKAEPVKTDRVFAKETKQPVYKRLLEAAREIPPLQKFRKAAPKESPGVKPLIPENKIGSSQGRRAVPVKEERSAKLPDQKMELTDAVARNETRPLPNPKAAAEKIEISRPPLNLKDEPLLAYRHLIKEVREIFRRELRNSPPDLSSKLEKALETSRELKALAREVTRQKNTVSAELPKELKEPLLDLLKISIKKNEHRLVLDENLKENDKASNALNIIIKEAIQKFESLYIKSISAGAVPETSEALERAKARKRRPEKPDRNPIFRPEGLKTVIQNQGPLSDAEQKAPSDTENDEDEGDSAEKKAEAHEELLNAAILEELQLKRIREEKFLKIQKVYVISGRVTDSASGAAIEGALVDGGELGLTVTDFRGEYYFLNVPNDKIYTLRVKHQEYEFTPSVVTDTANGPNIHNFLGQRRD